MTRLHAPRRWLFRAAACASLSALVLGGIHLYRGPVADRTPPAIDLDGIDARVADAVEAARRGVSHAPDSGAAWGLLGKVLLANEFFPEARLCLARAEELQPGEPRWPYLQAGIQPSTNPAAEAKLRRAIALGGDGTAAARIHLAEWLLGRGRTSEAEAEFRAALATSPGNPWARLGLAQVALERGDADAALGVLESPSGTSPGVRDVTPRRFHALRAECYQRRGDIEAAGREARRLRLYPKDPAPPDPFAEEVAALAVGLRATNKLIDGHLKRGQVREALRLLHDLARDYPDADAVWLSLGRAHLLERNPDAAAEATRRAVRLSPNSVQARQQLGMILLQQGKHAEAAGHFREAAKSEEAFAPAHHFLARCLDAQGDPKGAIDAMRAAVRYSPQTPEGHQALAELLAKAGQTEEAAAHLRDAIRLGSTDPKAAELLKRLEAVRAVPMKGS